MSCLIVQAQAAPCFLVITSQNCFLPWVSQESPQNTQTSFTDEEIFPRHGRDIFVQYFIVPILQKRQLNTFVRDENVRYGLRILHTRNEGTCLRGVGL